MTTSRFPRFAAAPLPLVLLSAGILAACGPSASRSPAASAAASASVAASAPADSPSEAASPSPSGAASDGLGSFACGEPVQGVGSTAHAQITDVRVGEQDGYDRVVFEFANGIPEFRVEPASPPFFQDASGLPLSVEGQEFLRITLLGGTKLSPEGGITYSGPREFTPGFGELGHLVEGGDFEAVSTWYAGLATPPCLRVLTLTGPSRLAIDIQH